MKIEVLKDEKERLEIAVDNLTIAELLRERLWQDSSIKLAAWRREHPSKSPVLAVETKGKKAKTALLDCIEKIFKENSSIIADFKKAIK